MEVGDIINLVETNDQLTHVMIATLGPDMTEMMLVRMFEHLRGPRTMLYDGTHITMTWTVYAKDNSLMCSIRSPYSDEITTRHGMDLVYGAAKTIQVNATAVVVKLLPYTS